MSRELIEECYRQMYRGMIQKDREILLEILDESFVLIHMTGMRQSKEVFIRAVENGTLNYFSANHQNIEIEVHGDSAQIIGQSVVNAAVFGGERHTWKLQLKIKLIKRELAWQMLEAKASTY